MFHLHIEECFQQFHCGPWKSLKQPKCQPNRKLSTSIVGYLMNMQLWRMSRRYIQQRTLIEKCSPSISCLVQMPVQRIDEDRDLNMGNPVRYWGAGAMAKLDCSGCQLWGYTPIIPHIIIDTVRPDSAHAINNKTDHTPWMCVQEQGQPISVSSHADVSSYTGTVSWDSIPPPEKACIENSS